MGLRLAVMALGKVGIAVARSRGGLQV